MTDVEVPMDIRLRLIHGTLQRLADRVGADVLHIKGPAVAPPLLDTRVHVDPATGAPLVETVHRFSTDADLLIRPVHVARFLAEATRNGWVRKTSFTSGSAFGHAVNLYHPRLGNADLHRRFPGLRDDAFDDLWRDRGSIRLGHVDCPTPSLTAQRLLLLLHAARSGRHHPDTRRAWSLATEDEREEVRRLARHFDAEIGVAAALDDLDRFRDHPDYLLWRYFRDGDPSRLNEWRARWRSATTLRGKLVVVRSLLFFDHSLLEAELGRRPTRRDVARRLGTRWARLLREASTHILRRAS